jgi:hypothetical protein
MNRFSLFLTCLLLGGKLLADEVPVHWEYFEPEVDYTRRLRVTGATTGWEIASQPTPDKTGSSLKLTFQFSKQNKTGVLVFDLPVLAFDSLTFRVWNPNPPTVPVYLHMSAFQSTKLGDPKATLSLISRYFGNANPDAGLFIRPGTPSAPLASSEAAGWIPVEVKFPQDGAEFIENGKRRPPGADEPAAWKNYAFSGISLLFETKLPESATGPVSLYIDDLEFHLTK